MKSIWCVSLKHMLNDSSLKYEWNYYTINNHTFWFSYLSGMLDCKKGIFYFVFRGRRWEWGLGLQFLRMRLVVLIIFEQFWKIIFIRGAFRVASILSRRLIILLFPQLGTVLTHLLVQSPLISQKINSWMANIDFITRNLWKPYHHGQVYFFLFFISGSQLNHCCLYTVIPLFSSTSLIATKLFLS